MTTRAPVQLNDAAIAALADELLRSGAPHRRYLLGIAGIPGSGKSTLAAKLVAAVNGRQPGVAALVPMDGFHFSNALLERMGLRQRKGAPATFDFPAYAALLRQAREERRNLHFPVYDRDLHEPVLKPSAANQIGKRVSVIVTEGNYLLLDEDPWRELATLLDACWMLQTDAARAREWIIARHIRGGRSPEDAQRHYEQSDRLNVELVLNRSRGPARTLAWGAM